MSLNKDFEEIYEFYVQSLIESIGKHHTHVNIAELKTIWKQIKTPVRKTKPPKVCPNPPVEQNIEYEKRKNHLENMQYDDLYRHCVRNGFHPPAKKHDMIKLILTRWYPS